MYGRVFRIPIPRFHRRQNLRESSLSVARFFRSGPPLFLDTTDVLVQPTRNVDPFEVRRQRRFWFHEHKHPVDFSRGCAFPWLCLPSARVPHRAHVRNQHPKFVVHSRTDETGGAQPQPSARAPCRTAMHLPPAARLQAVAYRGRATSTPPQRRCVPGCRAAKQSSSPFLFFVGHVTAATPTELTPPAVNCPEEREARWRRREGWCDVVGPDGTAEYV